MWLCKASYHAVDDLHLLCTTTLFRAILAAQTVGYQAHILASGSILRSSCGYALDMETSSAAGRLAMLAGHLVEPVKSQLQHPDSHMSQQADRGLQRNNTSSEEESRPAPGGGRGTLTVVDNRTGRKYTVGWVCWAPLEQKRAAESRKARGARLHGRFARCACMQLEVSDGGTINAQTLKQIKAGGDGVGLRTYDPG